MKNRDSRKTEKSTLTFETLCPKEEFDAFAELNENGSILQESKWAEIKQQWKSNLVAVRDHGEIKASALVLQRDIGFGKRVFYIPRGPLIDYRDSGLCRFFFTELKKWARSGGAVFIKIDPLILNSVVGADGNEQSEMNEDIIESLKKAGFRHHGLTTDFSDTVQPRTQAVVNLNRETKPAKKLNYYLQRARKKGVRVKRMGEEGAELFSRLESKTANRKNIALRNEEYFRTLMQVYGDQANISVSYIDIDSGLRDETERLESLNQKILNPQYKEAKKAEIREQIQSAEKSLSVLKELQEKYGETAYISATLTIRSDQYAELLYAGMDEELGIYRSDTAWMDAIEWARENGCRYCNLGGVEGTLDDSLAQYKKLYSPDFESYIGEFDLPVNRPLYFTINALIPAYRRIVTVLATRKKKNG